MIHDETLHKWINKTISAEELEEFKQRPEYEELLQLYDRTEDIEPPTFDANEMLANILATDKKEVVKEKPPAKVVAFPNWAKLAVAAALIGLIALFFLPFNNNSGVEIATKADERQKIDLPDGSNITLFGDSRIVYNEQNWQKKREVHLTGKATFEVEKNAPLFGVVTAVGSVMVLGTTFTVDAHNEVLKVACSEGRVAVTSSKGTFLEMITANESVQMTAIEMMAKKENLTKFGNTELSRIVEEIEREYDVTFDMKNVDMTERLTGGFQYKDLENALKTAFVGLEYETQGKKVILQKIQN